MFTPAAARAVRFAARRLPFIAAAGLDMIISSPTLECLAGDFPSSFHARREELGYDGFQAFDSLGRAGQPASENLYRRKLAA